MMEQEPESLLGIPDVIEYAYTDNYNLTAIRILIENAFMPREIVRYCQEHDFLRPVLAEFGPNAGLGEMADVVVSYCQKTLFFPELLSELRRTHPRRYRIHGPYICASAPVECDEPLTRSSTVRETWYTLTPMPSLVCGITVSGCSDAEAHIPISVTTRWPGCWWVNSTGAPFGVAEPED